MHLWGPLFETHCKNASQMCFPCFPLAFLQFPPTDSTTGEKPIFEEWIFKAIVCFLGTCTYSFPSGGIFMYMWHASRGLHRDRAAIVMLSPLQWPCQKHVCFWWRLSHTWLHVFPWGFPERECSRSRAKESSPSPRTDAQISQPLGVKCEWVEQCESKQKLASYHYGWRDGKHWLCANK